MKKCCDEWDVQCPDCRSTKLWVNDTQVASDFSLADIGFECQVCRRLFDVDYRPKGYTVE